MKKPKVVVVYKLPGNKYAVLTKLPFQTTQYDQKLTPELKKALPWSSTKKYSRSAMTECILPETLLDFVFKNNRRVFDRMMFGGDFNNI